MYKRNESGYTVVVADFGKRVTIHVKLFLSRELEYSGQACLKPKSVAKLRPDGRGNQITKAPEVMMGKDFDQKADGKYTYYCFVTII